MRSPVNIPICVKAGYYWGKWKKKYSIVSRILTIWLCFTLQCSAVYRHKKHQYQCNGKEDLIIVINFIYFFLILQSWEKYKGRVSLLHDWICASTYIESPWLLTIFWFVSAFKWLFFGHTGKYLEDNNNHYYHTDHRWYSCYFDHIHLVLS